jgi:hypothetical protein
MRADQTALCLAGTGVSRLEFGREFHEGVDAVLRRRACPTVDALKAGRKLTANGLLCSLFTRRKIGPPVRA